MKHSQQTLMTHDPAEGTPKPYPSQAAQWREWHGAAAWLFNPWTGQRRFAGDVGSDPFGHLILPPGEAMLASGQAEHIYSGFCAQQTDR